MTRTPRISSLITSMTVVAAAAAFRKWQLRWGRDRYRDHRTTARR